MLLRWYELTRVGDDTNKVRLLLHLSVVTIVWPHLFGIMSSPIANNILV